METASTYFTRRAQQERGCAICAASAAARSAHLEMALRLIKAATRPFLCIEFSGGDRQGVPAAANHNEVVSSALRGAFPLPATEAFQNLLAAVDRKTAAMTKAS